MLAAHEDAMHLRRISHKLRQNDESFQKIYLPLDDLTANLEEITRSVYINTTVREVSIFCEFIEDDWLTPEVWRIFRAVGHLPKLERLLFNYIGSDGDELPVRLLSTVVGPAHALKTLELSCVKLTGSLEDFVFFAQRFRQKPLRKFHMYGSYLDESEERSSDYLLDPILEEIAELETLEDVLITALDYNSLGKLSWESIGRLIHTSSRASVNNLVLGEFELNDEHIGAMSFSMEDNRTLKEISFGCSLGVEGATALTDMLRYNNTLEMLHIHVASLDGGEPHHIAIANALKENSALKRFSLYGTTGNVTSKTQHAYADMLKENYSLEEVEFKDEDESIYPQVEMFLKLNAHGRGHLLQSATTTRDDWVSAILQLHDELDCLFHLLSLNPAVLSLESMATGNRHGIKRKR